MNEHIPVMLHEALDGLALRSDGLYWDGTFGRGGHTSAILERLGEQGRVIGSDRDTAAAETAAGLTDTRFSFRRGSLEDVMVQMETGLAGLLWDLGCSTPQLKDPSRGFSFSENGPLDMRMDQSQEQSAATLVNETPEKELADLIFLYGEERFSRRIASRIVTARQQEPILDTHTLAEICKTVYPKRHYHRIHPATRTFQALRIAVNDELGQLERNLAKALALLAENGRAVIISFHSLEDRIVKHTFRGLAKEGSYEVITKRPLVPGDDEVKRNPASRSAKMRIIERI